MWILFIVFILRWIKLKEDVKEEDLRNYKMILEIDNIKKDIIVIKMVEHHTYKEEDIIVILVYKENFCEEDIKIDMFSEKVLLGMMIHVLVEINLVDYVKVNFYLYYNNEKNLASIIRL